MPFQLPGREIIFNWDVLRSRRSLGKGEQAYEAELQLRQACGKCRSPSARINWSLALALAFGKFDPHERCVQGKVSLKYEADPAQARCYIVTTQRPRMPMFNDLMQMNGHRTNSHVI